MLTALKQKFRTWLFRPQVESGTITLTQRRIFILPTRQGLGLGAVLMLMLLGDINYNLSLGYVLTFLLATVAVISMLHTFRNLARLQVRAGRCDAVFAGDNAQFTLHLRNESTPPRYQLTVHDAARHQTQFDIAAGQDTEVKLEIPATRRGWLDPGRLTLYSEFPLGLFHAWAYVHFATHCLVYPRPAAPTPFPASPAQSGSGTLHVSGDEDFSGLRNYVAGDALPRIAWQALAREQGLQVKQFSAPQGKELWLDWALLPALGTERKLEILTRWVIDAEAQGMHYGLRLPGIALQPAHGAAQRAECLRALALYGVDGTVR